MLLGGVCFSVGWFGLLCVGLCDWCVLGFLLWCGVMWMLFLFLVFLVCFSVLVNLLVVVWVI